MRMSAAVRRTSFGFIVSDRKDKFKKTGRFPVSQVYMLRNIRFMFSFIVPYPGNSLFLLLRRRFLRFSEHSFCKHTGLR